MKMRLPASIGILALFLLAGCGGGGDSEGGPPAVSYTGSTSPAVITDNNADAIGIAAYEAGQRSSNLSGPMGVSPERAGAAGSPRVLTLVRTLQSLAGTISSTGSASTQARSALVPKTIVTIDNTETDSFGGTMSYSLSVDDETGAFTGSMTFATFHPNDLDADTYMSGTAYVSGQFDSFGYLASMQFSFASFTLDDPSGSVTVGGNVSLDVLSSPSLVTINLVFRDNDTGKTVWITDYTMEVLSGPDVSPADGIPDYVEVSVAGTIYLHDYGYVYVSTPESMIIDADALNPSVGTMVMTNELNRSVRLFVIDDLTFNLDADLNADGSYEWTSAYNPYYW